MDCRRVSHLNRAIAGPSITNNKPTMKLSVEIDDALKAEHCVELAKDTHVSEDIVPGFAVRSKSAVRIVFDCPVVGLR